MAAMMMPPRIWILLFPLALLWGCSLNNSTEIVNVTGVESSTVDFAGTVTVPNEAGITAALGVRGKPKLKELKLYSPVTATTTAIDSAGKYIFKSIPRADRYFFQVRDSSGNTYLSAVAFTSGLLNIGLATTAEEMVYSEVILKKPKATLAQVKNLSGGLSTVESAILLFLKNSNLGNATPTLSVKTDTSVVTAAKALASKTVSLIK